MSDPLLPKDEQLPALLDQTEWQELLLAQLEKDFQTSGLDLPPALRAAQGFPALCEALLPVITLLLSRRTETFAQLLYRIDLSETQIKKAGAKTPEIDFPTLITRLIVLRELQKIVIRKRFSP